MELPKKSVAYYIFNDDLQKELDTYYNYGKDLSTRYYHKLRIINFKKLIDRIKFPQNAKILDIGCGCGIYAILLAESSFNTVGIDVSDEKIKMATIWSKDKKLVSIQFLKADGERMPFKDNTFDFIVCSEVFEHLGNPFRGMQEFTRVLKRSGLGIISMPNLFSLEFFIKRILNEVRHFCKNIDVDPHYKFSFIRIRDMLKSAGLLIKYNNSVGYLPIMGRMLNFVQDKRLLNLVTTFENWVSKKGFPFGASYFVVVRKK